jgi:hypothetical protein
MYYFTVFMGIVLAGILQMVGITVEHWGFWAGIGSYSLATAALTVKSEE